MNRRNLLQLAWLPVATTATPRLLRAAGEPGLQTQLLDRIDGPVVFRQDPDYEAQRQSLVWYKFKPQRYPEVIVRARSTRDVVEALKLAREWNMRVATRSTGHNMPGASLRNGGMLIDLSLLQEIHVDPDTSSCRVQPGVRAQQLMTAVNAHGLAFPTAHTSYVGLGGYLLGGGLGWNLQSWDVACRSIIEAEIVLADGRIVVATESEHRDLLWALRGAGPGFFGIVTRFRLRLYEKPAIIVRSTYIVPRDKIEAALQALDERVPSKSRQIELMVVLKHAGTIPGMPDEGVACVIIAVAFADSEAAGRSLLSAFESGRLAPLSAQAREYERVEFAELYAGQSVTDAESQRRSTVENIWTDRPGQTLASLVGHLERSPTSGTFVLSVYDVCPARRRDTSLPYFADSYVVTYALSDDIDEVKANFRWIDGAVRIMRPFKRGHYINEVEARRYPEHLRESFLPADWERLGRLRKRYDPENRFFGYLGDGTGAA